MSRLQVQGLCKSFGDVRAVDDVSFTLAPGELLALIGPNGAGKSTVFNLLNGQLTADAGTVTLDQVPLLGRSPRDVWRLGIGRTFQIAETFASLTVVENVQMALLSVDRKWWAPWRRAAHHRRDDAMSWLAQVGLHDQADRAAHELAYGDVKRLELAMALAGEPRLLLMDEPTAGMAPAERLQLMSLTRQLVRERGLSVLFTEHSMDVVFEHADRVLVLARGQVIADGTAQQVRDDPQVQTVYFGRGRTLPKLSATPAVTSATPTQSCLASVASRVITTSSTSKASEPLLQVQSLQAWYGAAQVLFDVHLDVNSGEVVALMGRNGAGKSSTLKALMGLMPRREGRLRFLSHDLQTLSVSDAARSGLAYVPEDRRIFTDLTVLENLQAGVQAPRLRVDGAAAPYWTVERVFDLFPRLAELRHRPGGRMSGGEQQMLTVARSLMGNPLLLLLDEPSEGVAPVIVEQMAEMVLTLKAAGVSILLSEQNLPFASWVADRAYVLEKGQVRHAGDMQALMDDEALRRQYLSL
jgi:branched-chain amino acid transport system ATP-binding protein